MGLLQVSDGAYIFGLNKVSSGEFKHPQFLRYE